MRADVHQPVAAVVTLVAADQVARLTDTPLGDGGAHRPAGRSHTALVVHRDPPVASAGPCQQRVRLLQVRTQRLLHVDVAAVLQGAQAERVVELGAGGDHRDVRRHRGQHAVHVAETPRNPQGVAEGVGALGHQVTHSHHLGAWVGDVGPASRSAARPTPNDAHTIGLHSTPLDVCGRPVLE